MPIDIQMKMYVYCCVGVVALSVRFISSIHCLGVVVVAVAAAVVGGGAAAAAAAVAVAAADDDDDDDDDDVVVVGVCFKYVTDVQSFWMGFNNSTMACQRRLVSLSHPTVKKTPLSLARVPVFLWIS